MILPIKSIKKRQNSEKLPNKIGHFFTGSTAGHSKKHACRKQTCFYTVV